MSENRQKYSSSPLYGLKHSRPSGGGFQVPPEHQPRPARQRTFVGLQVIMSLLLPALFVVALILRYTELHWAFLGLSALALLIMWLGHAFVPQARTTMTLIYTALMIVSLAAALWFTHSIAGQGEQQPKDGGINYGALFGNNVTASDVGAFAGGADIILLPEMPYNFDAVLMAVKQRNKAGKRFSILAVAEGAISQEDAQMSKKEYQKKKANSPFPSVSYEIGKKIQDALGQEVRIVVPGHTQRGGSPDAYDRVVASRLGAAAGRMVLEGKYGCMAAFRNNEIVPVPLKEVAGKLKMVDPKSDIIREARDMGISFGNEL